MVQYFFTHQALCPGLERFPLLGSLIGWNLSSSNSGNLQFPALKLHTVQSKGVLLNIVVGNATRPRI